MIEVRGLVKDHAKLRVLNGVSLSVKHGEVAVVIGPSGGGKSTLLRCINGLETFQAGEVRVEDCILRAHKPEAPAKNSFAGALNSFAGASGLCASILRAHKPEAPAKSSFAGALNSFAGALNSFAGALNSFAGASGLCASAGRRRPGEELQTLRRRVGMVFQQFHLFPHMNVLENVMAGPRYVLRQSRAEAEVEARKLLVRVGMGEKLTATPDQLSGGQQQRVAIARALAMRPEAVLFDEPTSALDPRMAAEVLNVITDLAQSGQTMVVVTHAMSFAQHVAHTVHVMHEGRIVESDTPAAIFASPRAEVTRSFLVQSRTS